jgi:oligopeptide/dipeptide ABC transporter ATP-binding protein
MGELLLAIRDLALEFRTYAGRVHALNGVDLDVHEREITGLVGETGCGKTMIGLSLLRLLPPTARIVSGSAMFKGEDLLALPLSRMEDIRGARMAMIFQDPAAALNPLYTIGQQIEFVMRRHGQASRSEVRQRASELLETVELPNPARILQMYPHELSGGMKQRVAIAIGLSCGAELLIADEPTTDLDVTVQAQILNLLRKLCETRGVAILMITHDLAVVAETCHRVAVLYAGRVVESGPVDKVLFETKHPYARALLEASPRPDGRGQPLLAIPGTVPSGLQPQPGCPFGPRCPHRMEVCASPPSQTQVGEGHMVFCCLYSKPRAT